jgi:metal-sulfur cluster biosynthetic enzyme
MATVEDMRNALKEVYDPEIPINIVDLGLVYGIEEKEPGKVRVEFTLTSPLCPLGDELSSRIHESLARLGGVTEVEVRLVWEPMWTKEKMTDDGRLQANMLGIG